MHYITLDMMQWETCKEFKNFFYATFGDKGMEVSEKGFNEIARPCGNSSYGWSLGSEWFRTMLDDEELIEKWEKGKNESGSYVIPFIKLYPGKRKPRLVDKIVKAVLK
jgi:hypothetical protein